jgi:ureidoacrylate peracid hydrolase
VRKHRLSAFFGTDLQNVLRHLEVRSLLLTGVYTEVCVESTARDAYFLDYYVVLVSDCCGTTREEFHRSALERCERNFGIVASGDAISEAWQRMSLATLT